MHLRGTRKGYSRRVWPTGSGDVPASVWLQFWVIQDCMVTVTWLGVRCNGLGANGGVGGTNGRFFCCFCELCGDLYQKKTQGLVTLSLFSWHARRDSNPQPSEPESDALSITLLAPMQFLRLSYYSRPAGKCKGGVCRIFPQIFPGKFPQKAHRGLAPRRVP